MHVDPNKAIHDHVTMKVDVIVKDHEILSCFKFGPRMLMYKEVIRCMHFYGHPCLNAPERGSQSGNVRSSLAYKLLLTVSKSNPS